MLATVREIVLKNRGTNVLGLSGIPVSTRDIYQTAASNWASKGYIE